MGIIEDTIFTVYREAVAKGAMDQAEHAVDLVRKLREKIDVHGFDDPINPDLPRIALHGNFFEPFPYRFNYETGIVVFRNTAILLTKTESHLFHLFTQYETQGLTIRLITHEMITKHMWNDKKVTGNALRIAIKRIREKIELDKNNPQVLVNHYDRGYLFLGKQLQD
jgi:hypothetical protein